MNLSRRFLIILLLLVIAIKAEASSTKSEYQIPGLIGMRSDINKSFNIPFDLNKTFPKIFNVELYIEGYASPGSAISIEGGKEQFEFPVQFDISIAERFDLRSFDLRTPIASFTSLSNNFGAQQNFKPRPREYTADWSFLKKGTGELRFSWGKGCPSGCRYINHSSVNITKAVLIVTEESQHAVETTIDKATVAPLITERGSNSRKAVVLSKDAFISKDKPTRIPINTERESITRESTVKIGRSSDQQNEEQIAKVKELFKQNNITIDDSLEIHWMYTEKSLWSFYHVECKQYYKGLPVHNGELRYYFDENGKLLDMSGHKINASELSVDTVPTITKEEAETIYGERATKSRYKGNVRPVATLKIYDVNSGVSYTKPSYVLVWYIANPHNLDSKHISKYPEMILDATNSTVYYFHDGIITD